jgi:hypothetical protein
MESALEWILITLLIIMLVSLVAGLVAYGLVSRWRRQIETVLLEVGGDLNQAGFQIESLAKSIASRMPHWRQNCKRKSIVSCKWRRM